MTRRLIMLRHGQTIFNATRRMQGQLDTELSDVGIKQAQAAARYVETLNIGHVVASDLQRARITAEIIAENLHVDLTVDKRLRETDLGEWMGLGHDEVDRKYPGARALWRHDATWAPPGGESRVDVARRARSVIDELMRTFTDWDDSTVLVVAHGGSISAATSALLGLEVSQYPMFSGLGNTCWSQLTARPKFVRGSDDALDPAEYTPDSARFTADNVDGAQWYLDGWNMGVELGMSVAHPEISQSGPGISDE